MRSLVIALAVAGMLVSNAPAWTQQTFFAARMDVQSWSGTLVDAGCTKANPTQSCEVAQNTEHFGLQTDDGKYVSGVNYSFRRVTYQTLGTGGLVVGLLFLGLGVVPLALTGAIWHQLWPTLWGVLFAAGLTFGARALGSCIVYRHAREKGPPEGYAAIPISYRSPFRTTTVKLIGFSSEH